MSVMNTTWRVPAGKGVALFGLVLTMLLLVTARADDIDVRTANIGLAKGEWRLNARIDYRLTDEMQEALESGVALTFRVDLIVDRKRTFLPDQRVLDLSRDWQLSYEPLTQRYLVAYPDGRESTSHASLFGALNAAGRLQGLPLMTASQLQPGETYEVALRAALNQRDLPAPLQMLAFWNAGFSLESDWYEWTLTP